MPISIANLFVTAFLAQASTSQVCEPPVIENARAKAAIYQKTKVIYVRPDSASVPDTDPDTLQLMVMAPADERPSRVSDDGQVMYLRPEVLNEPCRQTLLRLLDQSYGIRLQVATDEA
jgi:hypothetical protein